MNSDSRQLALPEVETGVQAFRGKDTPARAPSRSSISTVGSSSASATLSARTFSDDGEPSIITNLDKNANKRKPPSPEPQQIKRNKPNSSQSVIPSSDIEPPARGKSITSRLTMAAPSPGSDSSRQLPSVAVPPQVSAPPKPPVKKQQPPPQRGASADLAIQISDSDEELKSDDEPTSDPDDDVEGDMSVASARKQTTVPVRAYQMNVLGRKVPDVVCAFEFPSGQLALCSQDRRGGVFASSEIAKIEVCESEITASDVLHLDATIFNLIGCLCALV
jgi:hypothetical protein